MKPQKSAVPARNDPTDQSTGTAVHADARRSLRDGQCDPRPGDGRRGAGEIRPPRPADGCGRRRDGAVHPVPEIRRRRPEMAGPRPLRALRRPRLDAAVRAAVSDRQRGDDDRPDQALPPAGLDHAGASGKLRHPGRRDDDRPAGARHRHRRRHGDGGTAPGRLLRRRSGRPFHLRARLRRRPDGRHQPRGHRARWPPEAEQADRAVRRQRHLHRRAAVAGGLGRSGEAVRGRGLARRADRRARPEGDCGSDRAGPEGRQADHDRLQDRHRVRRADQGRLGKVARFAARRRRNRRNPQKARLDGGAVRSARGYPERMAHSRRARQGRPRGLDGEAGEKGRRNDRRIQPPHGRPAAGRAARRSRPRA